MSAPKINFSNTNRLQLSLNAYEDTQTMIKVNGSSQFVDSYKSLFNGKDEFRVISTDFSDYILQLYNESFGTVSQEILVGATFSQNSIVGWFNGQPFHTIPLTINLINRAILKQSIGKDYDISVANKPYNLPTSDSASHMEIYGDAVNLIFALITVFFLLTYWPVIFVAPYIKERETRAKLLQYISGTNRFIYWITSFVFDYVVFVVICCTIIGCIGVYQRNHFATFDELCDLVLISCSYGFAMLPLIYAFSYLFTKHSTGETIVSLLNILRKLHELILLHWNCF